jgi:hypothetical protein
VNESLTNTIETSIRRWSLVGHFTIMRGRRRFGSRFNPIVITGLDNPEEGICGGLAWPTWTGDSILINTTRLAPRLGIDRGSLCLDLRRYGFKSRPAAPEIPFIASFPQSQQWSLHRHPNLTRETARIAIQTLHWNTPQTKTQQCTVVQTNQEPELLAYDRFPESEQHGDGSPAIPAEGTGQLSEKEDFSADWDGFSWGEEPTSLDDDQFPGFPL